MNRISLFLWVGAAVIWPLSPCFANNTGAYFVDDADIADPHQVEVENWYSHGANGDHILATAPNFLIAPGLEFSLQYTASREGEDSVDEFQPQLKHPVFEDKATRVKASISGGFIYDAHENTLNDVYAYVPITYEPFKDRLKLHTNLGWNYDHESHQNQLTWGVASEVTVTKQIDVKAEYFGRTDEHPGYQLGTTAHLTKAADLDLIYGHDITSENANWLTSEITFRF